MLELYYEKYLNENPDSTITFEEWKKLLFAELCKDFEPIMSRINPHESVYGC